jgi:hypothetical protein
MPDFPFDFDYDVVLARLDELSWFTVNWNVGR